LVELFVYTKNYIGSSPIPFFLMKLFSKKLDTLRRMHFKNKEYVLLLRKLLYKNTCVSRFYKKASLTRVSYEATKINNHCILTGRTRAVYKGFKVSRFILKGMGSLGYLPGIRKCS
jgi:ribosomal protein S14